MAKMTAQQLDDNREQFEANQLSGLDALYAANPDSVDLDAAVTAGIVNIKDKIEVALPNHEEWFKRALKAEKRPGVDPTIAFKRAFEAVYGKVLFEHGRLDDASQQALTARLEKVLKTPIETSSDITKNPMVGRPELQVATERLRRFKMNGGKTDELLNKAFAGVIVEKADGDKTTQLSLPFIEGTVTVPVAKTDGDKVTVHGFETQFGHAANRLKEVREYFEAPVQIDLVRHLYNDLNTLVTKAGKSKFIALMKDPDVGLEPTAPIKGNIKKLDAKIQSKRKLIIQDQKNATPDQRKANEKLRDDQSEKIAKLDELLETLKDIFDLSKKLYEEMKALSRNLEVVKRANSHGKDGKEIVDVDGFSKKFKLIDLRSSDFDPAKLVECYKTVEKFLDDDTAISGVARALVKAEKAVTSSTNLTDEQAAKKIVAALVGEQFPDMPAEDRAKMAAMLLAEDVMRLQQAGSYEEIAREGSAELLETVKQAGFREKLIGFEFKVGDKVSQPFKGLKSSDFKDTASIEKLFTSGRLNHQNGFFALAAIEMFEGGSRQGVRSLQSVAIGKKLKILLAKKMGVDENLSDSRVAKIVNRAFDEQLEHVRPLVRTYFERHNKGAYEFTENKVKELNTRMKKLQEEYRLEKVSKEVFQKRKVDLLKEAEEFGVADKIEFSADSVVGDWFASKDSEWLRGTGDDAGKWFGAKGKGLGMSTLSTAVAGTWGATKLGASLGWQTALMPLRALKYSALVGAKPLVGLINLFRRSKWMPLPGLRETVRADLGRALAYTKDKTVGTAQRAYGATGTNLKKGWEAAPDKHKSYKERTKVSLEALDSDITEASARAKASAVEVADSPYLPFDKYVKELKELGFGAEVPKAPPEPSEEKHEETKKTA